MSPVQSPVASPIHSPLASPSSTSQRSESPDAHVASAILASLNASASRFMRVDELISRMEASRGEEPSDESSESAAGNVNTTDEEGTAQNPIELDGDTDAELDEEESEQFHLNQSVQRAYERFLHELNNSSSERTLASASLMSRRRPQNLNVITNRRAGVVIRLPNGGYTFAPQNPGAAHILSPRRRRRSARMPSSSSRPLIRQIVTLRNSSRNSAARGRLLRYSRHMTNQMTPSSPMASRRVSGFKLTESVGVPEDKCAICLEEYKVGDMVSYVACQPNGSGVKDHMFHQPCIESWVESLANGGTRERTCPVCRGVF